MMNPLRRLALAAALLVTAGAGLATAQTVIVRNAPVGSTVELALNATAIGSTTVARDGNATLPVNLTAHLKKSETDLNIFVDVCGAARRVVLAERAMAPIAPRAGCDRREVPGLFVVRGTTTLVVDVAGDKPAVWLSQGPAPKQWLSDERPEAASSERNWRPLPTGLVVFGGGGLAPFSGPVAEACGTVTDCSGKESRPTYHAGAGVWLTRFLGAEASYAKPSEITVTGTGSNFTFDNALDVRLLTIVGKVGIPVGPVRIYGLGGMNYHRATNSMTETIDDRTVTVDQVEQTINGGAQTSNLRTVGWGWIFGGGLEGWLTPRFALYGEVGRAQVKGKTRDTGEGAIDARATLLSGGIRIHIGR